MSASKYSQRLWWICLFSALFVITVFAGSSFLYPTNPWVDAQCFHTVARGITNGLVPYRDLIEQKGPLLYFAHVPCVLISRNSFFGVYLLEIVLMTLTLGFSCKTVRLFTDRFPVWLIPVTALLMATCRAFVWGDSAEELCLPFLAWALFDGMRALRDNEEPTAYKVYLRNGILAGIVMWIKFTLLGMFFAWMAVMAFECLIRRGSFWRAFIACALFLAGMLAASVPVMAYFAAKGAVGDLISVYIMQNSNEYFLSRNPIITSVMGLGGGTILNPFIGIFIAGGVGYQLFYSKFRKNMWQKLLVITAVIFTCLFQYISGRVNGYYYYILVFLAPLAWIPVARMTERLKERKRSWIIPVLTGVLCVAAVLTNSCIRVIGTDRSTLVQTRFSEIIAEKEDASLLNYGFLDGGFYLFSGVEPTEPWFCRLLANREACDEAQNRAVENRTVDFIVTCEKRLPEYDVDSSGYELAAESVEKFNFKDAGKSYYLYRRK